MEAAKLKRGRQASFGKSRDTATGKKRPTSPSVLNFNQKLIMAKSLDLNDFASKADLTADLFANLPTGTFWEHWFDAHAATQAAQRLEQRLDEHNVWEKAVNLEVLAKGKG
jgi:hypothetical protein